ncbi:MAG: hypothetical protein MUO23_11035 [Anaerolineales bacterium]|nr:hypothetical protein [Anaerolineales bacterium]
MRTRALLLLVLSILLTSCGPLWNAVNRSTLKLDVAEALGPQALDLQLRCEMVDSTRTGYCLVPADREQVIGWAGALGMSASTASTASAQTLPPLASEGRVGCLAPENFGDVEGLPAYWVGGRPEALILSGGGRFEYMLLLHNPDTGQACVQVSYAYG